MLINIKIILSTLDTSICLLKVFCPNSVEKSTNTDDVNLPDILST